MARKILGLDIREDAISAVLVKAGFKRFGIEGQAYIPIREDFGSALDTLASEMEIENIACIVAIPANRISFRNVGVPFRDSRKIRQILPFELESAIPKPVEDLVYDFKSLDRAGSGNDTQVFAALVEKSILDEYLEPLEKFGIRPEIVTAGGYALAALLAQGHDFPSKGLVVDVGKNQSTIIVIVSQKIWLVRSVAIDELDSVASLCKQIQRTLLALEDIYDSNFQPEGVFLSGRGLESRNLENEMERILQVQVRRTDIVRNMDAQVRPLALQTWNPPLLDGALALTLMDIRGRKDINFLRGSLSQKSLWDEHRSSIMKTVFIAGFVLMLSIFNILYDSHMLEQRISRLDGEITRIFRNTFPDVKRVVDPVQQMAVKIKAARKATLFSKNGEKRVLMIQLLNEISQLIPKSVDVEITRLVIGPENLLIDGITDTFITVDDIKGRLEGTKLFKAVTINSANLDRAGKRVRFKLKGGF